MQEKGKTNSVIGSPPATGFSVGSHQREGDPRRIRSSGHGDSDFSRTLRRRRCPIRSRVDREGIATRLHLVDGNDAELLRISPCAPSEGAVGFSEHMVAHTLSLGMASQCQPQRVFPFDWNTAVLIDHAPSDQCCFRRDSLDIFQALCKVHGACILSDAKNAIVALSYGQTDQMLTLPGGVGAQVDESDVGFHFPVISIAGLSAAK